MTFYCTMFFKKANKKHNYVHHMTNNNVDGKLLKKGYLNSTSSTSSSLSLLYDFLKGNKVWVIKWNMILSKFILDNHEIIILHVTNYPNYANVLWDNSTISFQLNLLLLYAIIQNAKLVSIFSLIYAFMSCILNECIKFLFLYKNQFIGWSEPFLRFGI